MKSASITPAITSRWSRIFFAGSIFLIAYFVARYGMWAWAPQEPWDIFVMNIPVIAFFWFVAVVQRTLRESDELQRRVHLEALGLAFLTVMLLLMCLGLLEEMPRGPLMLPWRDLWFALIPLYGICYLAARYRYR